MNVAGAVVPVEDRIAGRSSCFPFLELGLSGVLPFSSSMGSRSGTVFA